MSFGRKNSVNVSAPPVGPVKNIADIITELQKFKKDHNIKDGNGLVVMDTILISWLKKTS